MKKILLILLTFTTLAFSKSYLVSPIPLPKIYVQNLDPYPCSQECLNKYLKSGYVFSFLAHANKKIYSTELDDIKIMSIALLGVSPDITDKKIKIALLLPYKKIGKYASSTTNAVLAYMITKNHPFELKSYKIKSENVDDIASAINQLKLDGFRYVVAPLTQQGAKNIISINPNIYIYIPTINKKDVNTLSSLIYFGGIDYAKQSDLLLEKSVSPLVIFYDKSKISTKLAMYEREKFTNINSQNQTYKNSLVYMFAIPKRTTNLSKYLRRNKRIQNASFFINTPIVKTSMVMSQLTLYDTKSINILSTQINYNPLILSMTQYKDRKNMIIANSITENNNKLIEANSLLDNNIIYNWINYSTTIGVDYFFSLITNQQRSYKTKIINNQVNYDIELLKPSISKFVKYR